MDSSLLLLERLGALMQQSLRDDAARHGLLPIHIQVLAYLSQANHYSDIPIAVAEYFGITRGTVSQSLAVLERKGFLEKEKDPEHGRRLHLKLTPAGHAVLRHGWARRLQAAMAAAPEQTAPLDSALRALLVALQRENGQRAFGVCKTCAHFQSETRGSRCGLTKEPLSAEQSKRICREWTEPTVA